MVVVVIGTVFDEVFTVAGEFEVEVLDVGGGGLQGVEKERGLPAVDTISEESVGDVHDGDLDGIGVFEERKLEGLGGRVIGLDTETALALRGVEVAVVGILQGG